MTQLQTILSFMLVTLVLGASVGCSKNASNNAASMMDEGEKRANSTTIEALLKADKQLIALAQEIAQSQAKALADKERAEQTAQQEALVKAEVKQRQLANHNQALASQTPVIRKIHWHVNDHYNLSGDYAHNASAKRFIHHMSTFYDIDKNYLNRLFSRAKDLRLAKLVAATLPKKVNKVSKASKASKASKKRKNKYKGRYGKRGSWTRYRDYFVTPRHVNGGVDFWSKHEAELDRAHREYGVPPEYIVGILGVETIYGGNVGKTRVLDALSTKAFRKGRRQKFFRNELEMFLLMAQSEGLDPVQLMGSSAGALGLCQFMPSNFKPLGVDQDGNGVCNLWNPVDAIGSVANYLSKNGWKKGRKVAVRASRKGKGYKRLASGYRKKHSLKRLAKKGVRPRGSIDSTVRFLRMSTYSGDELWLGGHNFYVITRYNHSGKYALAVHQLAQEVKRRYKSGIRLASLIE